MQVIEARIMLFYGSAPYTVEERVRGHGQGDNMEEGSDHSMVFKELWASVIRNS